MFSISLKNTRSLTRNFLYLRPRRCIATGNKAVVGEWNGRWANKEREREREGESGPGSDGILISSRYRPASPRSFRLRCCLRGKKNRGTGACSFFNGKISKILAKLGMVLWSCLLFVPSSFPFFSSFRALTICAPSGGLCTYMRAKVSEPGGFYSRGGQEEERLRWGTWRIKLANKPPFVKATKLFIDEKEERRNVNAAVIKGIR